MKSDVPEPWAGKAADMAAWVTLMDARIKRKKTNIAALTREMGVARGSLDALMPGRSWPAFDVFTSMARAVRYWEIWDELAQTRAP